jgi:hypothetical protein
MEDNTPKQSFIDDPFDITFHNPSTGQSEEGLRVSDREKEFYEAAPLESHQAALSRQ